MTSNQFRIFAASIVFASIAQNVNAADGCYITNSVPQPRIYYTRQVGADTSPQRFFNGSNYYFTGCPSGASTSSQYAVILRDATIPRMYCWADRRPGGESATNPNEYNVNGYLVTFGIEQCPIDDFVPLILTATGFLGYFVLRQKRIII